MNTSIGARERRSSGIPVHPERTAALLAVIAGALAGGLVGVFAFATPTWVVAFSLIGAALGAFAMLGATKKSERDSFRDAELDREIGVTEGDIGARPVVQYTEDAPLPGGRPPLTPPPVVSARTESR